MAENLGRDLRENLDDLRPAFSAATDDLQARIHTSYPTEVVKFDKDEQTVTLKVQIKSTVRKKDGTVEKEEIPEIKDVPVYYISGGRESQSNQQGDGGGSSGQSQNKGYMITFPLKKGDEGIGIVSARSFDKWYDKSGMQEQGFGRMHHISDMMFLPGVKSKPRAKEVKDGVDDKAAQFRSVDGKHHYGVDENQDGGLRGKTSEHIKNNADKNVENEAGKDMTSKAGENMTRETQKVESSKAGKAIVKNAPKILLNSKAA